MKPRVVPTVFPTDDVVVAVRVLEPPESGDAGAPVQRAIDEVAAAGGGVVFLKAGRYRFQGSLTVKEGVTLRGDWRPPDQGPARGGTLLLVTGGRGKAEGPPAIVLERGSGLREVTIWYPDQRPTAITPYPWTIKTSTSVGGDNYTVRNVTLVNAYQGIKVGPEWNELHTIRNVFGTVLRTGIWLDTTTDIGRVVGVRLGPQWWERSGLPNAPTTDAEKQAVRAHLRRRGVGIDMGRSDWEYLWGVRLRGYDVGIVVRPGEKGTANAVIYGSTITDCTIALRLVDLNGIGLSASFCRFAASEADVQAPGTFHSVAQFNTCVFGGRPRACALLEGKGTLTFQNCTFESWREAAIDAGAGVVSALGCSFASAGVHGRFGQRVERIRLLGNEFVGRPNVHLSCPKADVVVDHESRRFARPQRRPLSVAPTKRPATEKLFVVTDFGASVANTDNTMAVQKALEAAGRAGGGTVYVPAGTYRFSGTLAVPGGVELRGTFDVPHHTVSGGSVLMPCGGRGEENGAPFLRLQSGAGLRGVTVWYPDQDLLHPAAYPWAIQALGPQCWVRDVCLGNAYQGADFYTHESTGHVISYLCGGVLRRGLFVSKCDGEGWVEDVQFNPHYTVRLPPGLPHPDYRGDVGGVVIDYQRHYLEGIVFGRCRNEYVSRTFLYAAHDGIVFRDDDGAANAVVVNHGTDTGSRAAVLAASGREGVEFVNAQLVPLGKYEVAAIVAPPGSKGRFRFFNSQVWAGHRTALVEGDASVLVQQMNTLSGRFDLNGGECTVENVRFQRNLRPHVRVGPGCRKALLVANLAPGRFRVETAEKGRCRVVANSGAGEAKTR